MNPLTRNDAKAAHTPTSSTDLRFHIVFSSAYFRMYVETSEHNWRLVRDQQEAAPVKPVLLFKSTTAAEDYAKNVLGITTRYLPFSLDWWETWYPSNWFVKKHVYEVFRDDSEAPMLAKVYEPQGTKVAHD